MKTVDRVSLKASTQNEPSFSITNGVGADFSHWLQSPWGGDKALKEATQVSRRAMRFLYSALSDNDNETPANEEYVDCVLGSPNLLMNFLEIIIKEWKLKSSGVISYLQAIADLSDYRKAKGCSDNVLRSFSVTEVYIRKCKTAMYRRRNFEYTRDLNLETLMARNSWCSLEDLNLIIPFHTDRFMEVVRTCRDNSDTVTRDDLVFATRFVSSFIFLRVKPTRPMSVQQLTIELIEQAKTNGGFVDATQFKTCKEYIFDSLRFTESSLVIVDQYIKHIRPLCNPSPDCDYVLVNSKGRQFTTLGSAMALMSFLAIGKHINPTRYRQILETASSDNLTLEQQAVLTSDQRHSSLVARR